MIGFRDTSLEELGLQHGVEVDQLSGTARVRIEVRLSAGRDGFGPGLGLSYGGGNSPFGLGWTLSGLPAIAVDTARRLPTYDGADAYALGGAELVPVLRRQGNAWVRVSRPGPPGWRVERWRARVERAYDRVERWVDGAGRAHWRQRTRDGTVHVYGLAGDGSTRVADPADPDARTFAWLLEASYDPKGNTIAYAYKAEDGAGVDRAAASEAGRLSGPFAQRYLKTVTWANSRPLSAAAPADAANRWRMRLVLDYGEHTGAVPGPAGSRDWLVRADAFSTHRPGFEVRTWRLCRRLLMFHQFPELGADPVLVGATELGHREDPAGSVLERVAYRGYRDGANRAVPPVELRYSQAGPDPGSGFEPAATDPNLPVGLDGGGYRLVDLHGEGLPGVLAQRPGGWYYKPSLGGGRFGPVEAVSELPVAPSGAFQLSDFDADGSLDLVGYQGREAGSYRHDRRSDRWQGFAPFGGLPRVDFEAGRPQLLDLDGDGDADLAVALAGRLVWYPARGRDGFGPAEAADVAGPAGAAPVLAGDAQLGTFLADMNGDGLLDLVRVASGRIEYWPNLGQGRFSAPVLMDDSPQLAGFGQFDPGRVRLVDLDRTGTADLLYLDHGQVRCWSNLSGNRFGPERVLGQLPWIDTLASAQVVDFLGDGTSCLVWSTPVPAGQGAAMQYLRLGGPLPPGLLVEMTSGGGRTARLTWRSSAEDYLRDQAAGRPWPERLPQHAMVVGRLELADEIGGTSVSARYEYHDGHFDEVGRNLVGFGQVDAYDTPGPGGTAVPGLVRTWYLTGDADAHAAGPAGAYARDQAAPGLPAPMVEEVAGLTTDERLGAHRALAGLSWRTETYPVGPGGAPGPHPFTVESSTYRVARGQPAADPERPGDAGFAVFPSETLRAVYELDPADPRLEHEVVLATGPYGDVTRRLSLAYPRRPGRPGTRPEQLVTRADLQEATLAAVDEAERYQAGIPTELRTWALSGLGTATGPLGVAGLRTLVTAALAAPLGPYNAATPGVPMARLTAWARSLYWDGARAAALPLGQVGPVVLGHHDERAMLPGTAVAAAFDGHVAAADLTAAGYVLAGGWWWASGPVTAFAEAARFYQPVATTSAMGVTTTVELDQHALVPVAQQDQAGNRDQAEVDYLVMAAASTTDANGVVEEVAYDPLGVAVLSGWRGQVLSGDGAAHPCGSRPLAEHPGLDPDLTPAALLADPAGVVASAGSVLCYDLWAFARGEGPPASVTVERERHADDGEGGAPGPSPVKVTLAYLDGFGRQVQRKVRAGPGPAVRRDAAGAVVVSGGVPEQADAAERWLVSGHEVFDDKGQSLRVHEPFFSTLARYESDAALRAFGVASTTAYDAAGRPVRQDLPDGTSTTSAYAAWSLSEADQNDNVTGSAWAAARQGLPTSDPGRRALDATLPHAGTTTVTDLDSGGRPVRVTNAGLSATTTWGDLGPEAVTDPRGVVATATRSDLLGAVVAERSADAGASWALADADGRPALSWREVEGGVVRTRTSYDQAGRAISTRVDGLPGLDNLVELVTYGDDPAAGVSQAALRGARGRVVALRDQAGLKRIERYGLDGTAVEVVRVLREAWTGTVDWSTPAAVTLQAGEHRSVEVLDALGRLVSQALPDGTLRVYEYDGLGSLARMLVSTADGVLDRAVVADRMATDAHGRRSAMRLGNQVEVAYGYDRQSFRLAGLTATRAGGGRLMDVGYTYDPVGNLTSTLDLAQEPGAATPLLIGLTASTVSDYTYDPRYRLRTATGRVHQALLAGDAWADGDPPGPFKGTRHLSLANGAAVERYTQTFAYDDAGNLTSLVHQGQTSSWTTKLWVSATSNRSLPALDAGGVAIADPEDWFDAAGNTVRLNHLRRLDWDHAGRLVAATIIERPGAQPDDVEHYVHDGDGRRVRRVTERLVAGGQVEVTDTLYLDGCELRRVSVAGATRLARTTSHLGDGTARLATLHQWSVDATARETDDVSAKKLHYLVTNHLGSVSLELDGGAQVISYEEYFPYGGTSFMAGDDVREVRLKDYRYCGKARDDATGLYSFDYRAYAPWIGHWLSPDPAGDADGPNRYQYCHGNPVRFVDGEGLFAQDLQVKATTITTLPADVQRQLDASPELRARLDQNQVIFRPEGQGHYTPLSIPEFEDWVRAENAAGRIPVIEQFNPEANFVSAEDLQESLRILQELFEAGRLTEEDLQRQTDDLTEWGRTHTRKDEKPKDEAKGGDGPKDAKKDGKDGKQSAHPADGSNDKGGTTGGKTGETGSNGNATTGKGPGGNGDGPAREPGGEQGQGRERGPGGGRGPGRGRGPGGGGQGAGERAGRRGPGGLRPGSGQDPNGAGSVTGIGRAGNAQGDVPRVPITERTGPGGIPYRSGLHASADARGEPAVDAPTTPGAGTGGEGSGGTDPNGRKGTWWGTVVKVSGWLNFTFSDDDDDAERAEGGIPGGLGLLGLHGLGWQILYVVATVISTIAAIFSLIKSIATGGLKALLANIWKAFRSPLKAAGELWGVIKAFGAETLEALKGLWASIVKLRGVWQRTGSLWEVVLRAFRLGGETGRASGPLNWFARLFKGKEAWETERGFRKGSWLFRNRWFGQGPWYNTEHVLTRAGAATAEALAWRNGFWNTWLRLPMVTNSWLGARLLPKVVFYTGVTAALVKAAFAGWWAGREIVQQSVQPPPAPAGR
jgi:RHS repeat-associated protein